jgi:hypothetical protein
MMAGSACNFAPRGENRPPRTLTDAGLNLASNVRDLGAQGVRRLLEAIDFHPLDLIEHGLLEGPRVLSSNAPDLVGTQERNELQGAHQGDRDRLRVDAHRRLGDELVS